MTTYINVHVLQSVPPSCINRDDTGSPKSAIYGGKQRARVSSQSWKRAVRLDFIDRLDTRELGTRTKRVVAEVAAEIARQDEALSGSAENLAEQVFKAVNIKVATPKRKKSEADEAPPKSAESGYLLFLSAAQIANAASLAVSIVNDEGEDGIAAHKKEFKKVFQESNSVDVALFGRMVADDTDLNVDAACQVAHALSTHAVASEFDFFTAVDDAKHGAEGEDAGAGMMGTVEFNSATLYRFATINVDGLKKNLGTDESTLAAIRQFVESFIRSMPTGKSNTFANRTLPEAVVLEIRDDQPVSWVGAFEKPVLERGEGFVGPSVAAMTEYAGEVDEMYGREAVARWASGLPSYWEELERFTTVESLPAAVNDLVETVAPYVMEAGQP